MHHSKKFFLKPPTLHINMPRHKSLKPTVNFYTLKVCFLYCRVTTKCAVKAYSKLKVLLFIDFNSNQLTQAQIKSCPFLQPIYLRVV